MIKLIRKLKALPALDRYVIFSITFTIVYTIAEFVMTLVTSISHDVLTECVYKFFVGEVVVCGLIKIFKLIPTSRKVIRQKLEDAVGFELKEDECIDDGK